MAGNLCPHRVQPLHRCAHHLLGQKQQRTQRLILSRRAYLPLQRQPR